MYEQGEGIEANYAEAIKWLRKAVDQGHAAAQAKLGEMYWLGTGVAQDLAKANQLFKSAAEQGDSMGQAFHGMCCAAAGRHDEAMEWYRKSAGQGNGVAYCGMGWLHQEQNNLDAAEKCYRLAVENGCEDAADMLRNLYEERTI